MVIPDTNLLIYAYDRTAPDHEKAREWWEEVLSGNEPVGIPWVVILAFVRLMTHPTLSENPMTAADARAAVQAWLDVDAVRILNANESTFDRFFDLLESIGTGGNLSTDALIAATAIEHGGRVFSNDADFGRFERVSWKNPLTG